MRARAVMWMTVLVSLVILSGCGEEQPAPEGEEAGGAVELNVVGTNDLRFDPSTLTAEAGEITVELTAEEAVNHTFVVEDANGDVEVAEAAAGATDSGSIDLEAAEYTFYCSVPGHREAGMEGTLTVE
jgi:plastocyanin